MSAYMIAIRRRIFDASEMKTYVEKGSGSLPNDARVLAAYGKHKVLEGPAADAVLIAEFPTSEAARDWYNSDRYQDAKAHRIRGAEYEFILVEGL